MKGHFYHDGCQGIGQSIELSSEESKHLVKVLRAQVGDAVLIFDGRGTSYRGVVQVAHQKRSEILLEAIDAHSEAPTARCAIAIAPTKNISRLEWFLEKATEIGITDVHPILCQHSERKVIKAERLERIILSAMTQSKALWLPRLHALQPFAHYVQNIEGQRLIACCDGERKAFNTQIKPGEAYTVCIGPEGDFSPQEVAMAREAGWQAISFGEQRLRVETAALYAVSGIAFINS